MVDMIRIGEKEYTPAEVNTLVKAGVLNVGLKHDPGSTSLGNTPALHGPLPGNNAQGGLFTQPGVRPQMFSAVPRLYSFAKTLAISPSEIYNEILEIATGVTSGTGDNSTGFCDPNAPVAGQLKTCSQTFKFGKLRIKTNLRSVMEAGLLRTRADVPRDILNAGPLDNPLMPSDMFTLDDTRSELRYEYYLAGFEIERGLEYVGINGNPALSSTNTRRGWIKEFAGLDSQIKTGYTDSVSGVACPAADSVVETWGTNITGTDAAGRTITTIISDIWYGVNDRARQVGMEQTGWAFYGRPEMFRALTDVYANNYATTRFTLGTAANPLMQTAGEVNNFRLAMLNQRSLMVEGIQVPWIDAEGMPLVKIGGTTYEADLFLVPLNWAGQPLLRLEYFDVDNPYATELRQGVPADDWRSMNGGMYLVGKQQTAFCPEYHIAAQMRLILETPFLAARIDNIRFSYNAQTRHGDPAETYFYSNGGQTYRPDVYAGQA